MTNISYYLNKLKYKENLSSDEIEIVMKRIMSGEAQKEEITEAVAGLEWHK